jgi:hypothetical protein
MSDHLYRKAKTETHSHKNGRLKRVGMFTLLPVVSSFARYCLAWHLISVKVSFVFCLVPFFYLLFFVADSNMYIYIYIDEKRMEMEGKWRNGNNEYGISLTSLSIFSTRIIIAQQHQKLTAEYRVNVGEMGRRERWATVEKSIFRKYFPVFSIFPIN